MKKNRLITDLQSLGVHTPSTLMVHASLSALGFIEGGAETVVDALRDVTGPDGAVIAPSFRDSIRSTRYALRECAEGCPRRLCPSREPGFTGIVGETIARQPDSLRSCHPTHSWVGIGGAAEFLLEGHGRSPTPCGAGSPFFQLMERDGAVLLLGVGIGSLTNIHAVEDVRNVPYLSAFDAPRRHATYTTSGRRLQYAYPELLLAVLRECGLIRTAKVGASTSFLLPARALGSFLWVATAADPWCLVLRPRGPQYDPFADACAKTLAMAQAWRRDPDHDAWREFLAASKVAVAPRMFEPAPAPAFDCPAYRGFVRGSHRCAANDLPPWERFEDHPGAEPGVATCGQCDWPVRNRQ